MTIPFKNFVILDYYNLVHKKQYLRITILQIRIHARLYAWNESVMFILAIQV